MLWGTKRQRKIRLAMSVAVDDNYTLFRHFSLMCDVEEVARFGVELENEIIFPSPNWASGRHLAVHDIYIGQK